MLKIARRETDDSLVLVLADAERFQPYGALGKNVKDF
jgi:hypothetical protein